MTAKRKSDCISDEIGMWLEDEDRRSWPPQIYVKGVDGADLSWTVQTFVYATRDDTHCQLERIRVGTYKVHRTWNGIVDEFDEVSTLEALLEVLGGEGVSQGRWAIPEPSASEIMVEWLNSPQLLMQTHTIVCSGKQFPMWIVSATQTDHVWTLQCRWKALEMHQFRVTISGEAPRLMVNVVHPDIPEENYWTDIRNPHEVLHCLKFGRELC